MEAFALPSVEPAFHQDFSFKNQLKTSFFFHTSLFQKKKKKKRVTEAH